MPDIQRHSQIIRGREVVADDWGVLRLAEGETPDTVELPAGKLIVPLPVWQARRAALLARAGAGQLGIWLAADELAQAVRDELSHFAVVAVDFPKFSDGRGYSIAFNLRRRLGYQGELRAIGDVLRDQLFQMRRCGFDAYAPRQDRPIADALKGLTAFSEPYQASVDQSLPLFRRRPRGPAPEYGEAGSRDAASPMPS